MAGHELIGRRAEADGVELIVLRNPPVNALSGALLDALEVRVAELPASTRCLILTADGPFFSAGADLKELARMDPAQAPARLDQAGALFGRIAAAPFASIAALNGLTVGGGLELALACDVRVASESAKLGFPESSLGLVPAVGGTQRLPRLVGPGRALEMVLSAQLVTAAEALRIGLVNRVVPVGQELRAARDLAHTIAQRAPKAIATAKRAIREGAERPLVDGLRLERELFLSELLPSDDLQEGLRAFQERRPPRFKGT
ncbi:MAG TPA: enoyl-CoA hydratase-related protein [Thermoplasmata archaeon]|nr:enoyl-CoA hydratase-related protein [Thermoplasmata archaeon]